eukprot:2703201-Pleurochrysis_carterae.AAC.1
MFVPEPDTVQRHAVAARTHNCTRDISLLQVVPARMGHFRPLGHFQLFVIPGRRTCAAALIGRGTKPSESKLSCHTTLSYLACRQKRLVSMEHLRRDLGA